MNQSQDVHGMNQNTMYNAPMMEEAMVCKLVYPEVYYKLQPYIMMVCDEMGTNYMMPTQEMVEQMSDNIYDEACRIYPELEEYANNNDYNSGVQSIQYDRYGHYPYGRRYRRRGLFRDLIDILLLTELFGRRRRYYNY